MNGQSFNSKRERLLSALSIASMILILALLLLAFIFAMYKLGVIELPAPVEKLFGGGGDEIISVLPNDDGRIYEALAGGKVDPGYGTVEYDLSADDMYEALKSTVPVNCYTARFTVTLSEGGRDLMRSIILWRDGDRYRVEIYENSALKRTAVCDGKRLKLSDHAADGSESDSLIYPAPGNISPEEQASLPVIPDIFESGYSTDAEVSLLRTEQNNVYYVKYNNTAAQSTEELYISLEYGLVMRAESRDAGGVFYTLRTDSLIPELRSGNLSEESLFEIETNE